jgi:hypothetical protein
MQRTASLTTPVASARITGLVGAVVLASGSFGGYAATKLIVRGDAAATSSNIVASHTLFRLSLVGSLVMMVAFLVYALLLYRLLHRVNRGHAVLMVALALVSVPIYMLNQVNLFATLPLASAGLHEQVSLVLELHRLGNLVAVIFFGLWLIPLGLLVLRSGFLPRTLGILLLLGSPGYLILFVQAFLFPGSERTLWSNPFLIITHLAEIALMLWLLIRGVNAAEWERRAVSSSRA